MNTSLSLLVLSIFFLSFKCSSDPVEDKSTTLSFTGGTNIDTSNDSLRLKYAYVQEGNNSICFEAERASVLRFTPDKGVMGKSGEASGGLYVAYVDHAEFHFEVKIPGRYTAWYRALYPWVGCWNHTENMDGAQTHAVTDSMGKVLHKWIWSKGPTYQLAAGKHSWNFTPAGWCGGTQLDKVVLVREGSQPPSGLGCDSSRIVSPPHGEITSEVISRKNVLRWGALTVNNTGGKGAVNVVCSTDGGNTWKAVPDSGDLSSLPADATPIFKVTLTADNEGASPFITRATVSYMVRKVPPIVLENRVLQIRFSGENGALLGIRNKKTMTEYMDADIEAPLFSFMALRSEYGALREIGFTQAELKKVTGPARGVLRLDYDMMGGSLKVGMKIGLERERLARFSMDVTNDTPYTIAIVKLPVLRGLRIGDDPTDDYLMTPILTGGIAKYPASMSIPRQVYNDRPLLYPGVASMCWMDLWDQRGSGLYLACEDRNYRVTELTFSPGKADVSPAETTAAPLPPTEGGYKMAPTPGRFINLGFSKRLRVARGMGTVQVPEVVLGIHEGDWHWGSDRYREWAESWMVKSPVPDWFRDDEGWVDIHMIHLGSFVDISKGWPYGTRKLSMQKPPFPFFTCWAQMTSCEAYWSSQFLHRLLGSEEEFAAGIQKQHEMGNRMAFYMLPPRMNPVITPEGKRFGCIPRAMVPDDEIPPKGFYPEVALRHWDGSMESPDGVYGEAGCCMGATKWRQYLDHILLDKYVRKYGADGMYLDGIGLVTYDCANLNHGHAGYGEWSQKLNEWLAHIKTETRRVRPGAVFSGEGMNDVDHRYLDVGLFYIDNSPEVYRYTFPHNIGVIHGAPIAHYKAGWPSDWYEFVTVYGLKLGGLSILYENSPEKFAQVVRFRKMFSQFQSRARFVDEVGLQIHDPDVKGKLYARNEPGSRGALVVVYNEKEKKDVLVHVHVKQVGALQAAWAFTFDGAQQKIGVRKVGNVYQFTLPASRLSAVLVLEKLEPLIDIEKVASVVRGEHGVARVRIRNLEDTAISGKVSLQLPSGWKTDARRMNIAPGTAMTFELRFSVPSSANYDVYDLLLSNDTLRCIILTYASKAT